MYTEVGKHFVKHFGNPFVRLLAILLSDFWQSFGKLFSRCDWLQIHVYLDFGRCWFAGICPFGAGLNHCLPLPLPGSTSWIRGTMLGGIQSFDLGSGVLGVTTGNRAWKI